jgi:hypothetical protein
MSGLRPRWLLGAVGAVVLLGIAAAVAVFGAVGG